MNSLLSVQNLFRTYTTGTNHVEVLRGVNFDMSEGEILALTGASGVGKSTLLHLIGGLDRPSLGEVYFQSKPLSSLTDMELAQYRNKSIGMVFQFHHLLPEFTAVENVAMPLLISSASTRQSMKKAESLLEVVGLSNRRNHRPPELSGGEQQRIALARAMVGNPSLILADEPTGNLDEETGKMVFNVICRLNQTFKVSFIVATHNLNLARASHRWMKMTDGKVEPVEKT